MSRKWKFRRLAVSSLLALSALSVALPAGAQSGTTGSTGTVGGTTGGTAQGTGGTGSSSTQAGATSQGGATGGSTSTASATTMSEADAIRQADILRQQRRNQQAVELLMPYTGSSRNADLFRQIGRSQREMRTPADCKAAVASFTKALEIRPNNTTYLADRAGAYDCLDKEFLVQRAQDRQSVVDILEAASPTKTATSGAYADLGNALNDLSSPSGAEFVDLPGAQKGAEYLRKALAIDPASQGIRRDLAGLTRDKLRDFSSAYTLYWEAYQLSLASDQNAPNNNRLRGVNARVLTTAPSGATIQAFWLQGRYDGMLGAEATARATGRVNALRNESIEYYSKYINAFEGKVASEGMPAAFQDSRFGAGNTDPMGAYGDRANVYRAINNRDANAKAMEDRRRRTQLEPREPDYWADLADHAANRMSDLGTAGVALKEFFKLTDGHVHNAQPNMRAIATRVCIADRSLDFC